MPDRDLIARAETLTESVRALDETVQTLRHDQRLIKAIVGVLGVLLLVVGAVAGIAWQASRQAEENSQNARIACEVGNQARAAQIQLWGYILDQQATQPSTPARKRQLTEFRAYVRATFAPRDCNNLASPAPSVPTR